MKKYIMQSWNKYGKNSAHISGKSQVRNEKLWNNTRYVHLFSIYMTVLHVISSLLLYYLYMLYVAIQTNIVDFIFNYIKKKKTSVFPHHFIILVICHKNATRTGSSLTLNFMNYTYFSQSRYSQCFKNCVYSV